MRASAFFFSFFLLFTTASIAVPIPLFPGSIIPSLLEMSTLEYISYLGALTNGLTYGLISWIIFYLVDRKMDKSIINEH